MQQIGIVSHLDGDRALVTGDRASTCGSCPGKSSCATLGAWKQRKLELQVANDLGAKVGDEVVIEVPDALVLKSAYMLYGLPMLFFLLAGSVAYFIAQYFLLGSPDLMAAISAIAAVVIYYMSGIVKVGEKNGMDARIVYVMTEHETVKPECYSRAP